MLFDPYQTMNKKDWSGILQATLIPISLVVVMWTAWLVQLSHPEMTRFGIFPGKFEGLKGILFSPFLHDPKDISHLINNTFPFLFLGWALFYFYRELAFRVLLIIWLVGGFWVWLVANPAYHIGASGWVYGLASFLFFSGVIRKHRNLMGLTLMVSFFYGGMIWGIFPYDIRISWESHLFGGLIGLVLAIHFRKVGLQRERFSWENEESENIPFSDLNKRHEHALHQPSEEEIEQQKKVVTINYHYHSTKEDKTKE